MRDIRVASVQFEHAAGDKAANLRARSTRFAEDAAAQGAEIVVCPELPSPGFWFLRKLSRDELAALAEPVPDGLTSTSICLRFRRGWGSPWAWASLESGRERLDVQHLCGRDAGRRDQAPHRKIHAFESHYMTPGSEYHGFRHAARVPRRRADLLRLQHHRERPHHRADGRRYPPCPAPDRRRDIQGPAT